VTGWVSRGATVRGGASGRVRKVGHCRSEEKNLSHSLVPSKLNW
jgi:hypothetical protein